MDDDGVFVAIVKNPRDGDWLATDIAVDVVVLNKYGAVVAVENGQS